MTTLTIYPLDNKKIWTGEVIQQDAKLPITGVVGDEPPELFGDEVAKRMGKTWVILPEYPIDPPPSTSEPIQIVPESITRRQCKQKLVLMGLLDDIQPLIDAIEDPTAKAMLQIYWDDSLTFDRQNEYFIQMAYGLGLTDAEIDTAFIEASLL